MGWMGLETSIYIVSPIALEIQSLPPEFEEYGWSPHTGLAYTWMLGI